MSVVELRSNSRPDLAELPVGVPFPASPARPRWYAVAKRAIDMVFAATILLVTLPVVALAVVGIVVVTRGNPVYRQDRVGLGGRRFRMWKLRTMVRGAHQMLPQLRKYNEADGPVFKMRDDPRLHVLGAFLRRTSIDELPNFVNVLFGEMALVGPRPPLPEEVAHYDAYALRRLVVKPGVTCLWQISGRSHLSFEEWMALDNAYIDAWSPWYDLAIVAKTIPAVLRGVGAH
ncbi:MAG: Undecaprenyl-phosphate galactose phosphotransferase [Candidatus Eremiobacteraeota bacterium]|nr:Undecaprenyl-phosphate galactose phosphotransferase [Candidatus Eremiobacteraeota bacterium]